MNRRPAGLFLILLLCVILLPMSGHARALRAATAATLEVGVITMAPGEQFWERFGHDAIVVRDPSTNTSTSYNFGFFDMTEPNFVGNFIRGHMQYYLVALPTDEDLDAYRQEGRGVSVQWLDLDPREVDLLVTRLKANARAENARYRYDYYTDNCSTKVRDAIDDALGGSLRRQLTGRSQGNTYRSESVRLAWPAKWMAMGFHVGMSSYGDRPLSRWEESFIPMRLRDALAEARLSDGRPLVIREETLLPHRISLPPAELPRWRVPAFFTGLLTALALVLGARRWPRWVAALAFPFWLVSGLAGSLMFYLWVGTEHVAGHGNENLLLLSPLCLLLLPGAVQLARGRSTPPWFDVVLWLVAASAAIAGFLKFLPSMPQENVEWVLLLLPIHLAFARILSPRR